MFIHQFEVGPWDNFLYFVGDDDSRECAVVDPAWDHHTILAEAERLDVKITAMFCTHSHFDHVNMVGALLETLDVPVYMLKEEAEFSEFKCPNLHAASAGDVVSVGKTDVRFLHTPGHTPGSTSFLANDALVTGDTLFVEGCGRCDFVGGDPETMYKTLQDLVEKLPNDTRMFPGHNYGSITVSTLDHELKNNPYLQHKTVGDFVNHRMDGKTPNTNLPAAPPWPPEG